MKVIVLAPYDRKIIKAAEAAYKIQLGEIIVIGSKERILNVCNECKVNSSLFKIYDIDNEEKIVNKAKEFIEEDCVIIVDNIDYYYQRKMLMISDEDDFNYINIIDLPSINHFIFICSYPQKSYIDFKEKRRSILEISKFMGYLGIKKINASLVSNLNSKADFLEANIIRMIIKDSNYKNINMLNPCRIYDLFKNETLNIQNNNINLLILKNYETSKMFTDMMNIFANCKVGSLMTYKKNYLIDVKEIKDEQNVIFSMLVTSKVINNKKFDYDKKQYIL